MLPPPILGAAPMVPLPLGALPVVAWPLDLVPPTREVGDEPESERVEE